MKKQNKNLSGFEKSAAGALSVLAVTSIFSPVFITFAVIPVLLGLAFYLIKMV